MLGRRTYDIFAAYWPHQDGGADNAIATLFNRAPKYVRTSSSGTCAAVVDSTRARLRRN
ncbi:hypothetical protein RHRU231_790024 [Rhodococcus ruber]|uniref:Uncharacterized protein n=1 Tax=Rhodococcus ruber TaxID=1830 RepID=A0A098BS82_9NOCA|nr:hypothetical protein RHRU231_790024 [Rhodococcus ruber]